MHLDATEHRDGIVFLHAVKEGPASRSYGLAVAQLAGVPREVIAAAREYLAALEKGGAHADDAAAHNPRSRGRAPPRRTPQAQLPLEPPAPPPPDPRLLELEAALRAVSADDLTPRAALDLVYKLRALLDNGDIPHYFVTIARIFSVAAIIQLGISITSCLRSRHASNVARHRRGSLLSRHQSRQQSVAALP